MRKKNGLLIVAVLLVYFIGAAVLLYPMVASMLAKKHQLVVVDNYISVIEDTDRSEIEAEFAAVEKYNASLLENSVMLSDPFDPDAPEFPDGEYNKLLDFSDVMAYIKIPRIKVNLPVYHGSERETLEKGVGHLEGTSLPVGGNGTHACLSAHSGLPTAELFTNLTKLEIGDMFYIHVLDKTLAYQVDNISVVEPTDISLLTIEEGTDYITLITCTPYAVNTHRLLVRGTRVDYTEEAEQESIQKVVRTKLSTVEKVQLGAIALGVVLFAVLIVLLLKPKKQRGKY